MLDENLATVSQACAMFLESSVQQQYESSLSIRAQIVYDTSGSNLRKSDLYLGVQKKNVLLKIHK